MTKGKILVVDDEFHTRDSIRLLLEKEGYQVAMAPDGEAGLGLLAQQSFDAALVDLQLPGMDGMELMKQGRKIYPDLPFIIVTGYPSMDRARSAVLHGACEFIVKPFKIERLLHVLERCLGGGKNTDL